MAVASAGCEFCLSVFHCRMCSFIVECVFSYSRMCSLIVECVICEEAMTWQWLRWDVSFVFEQNKKIKKKSPLKPLLFKKKIGFSEL